MENNPIKALEQINEVTSAIQEFQTSPTRDYQKLDEVLPLALAILNKKRNALQAQTEGRLYFAPIWVGRLLQRLSEDPGALHPEEYAIFQECVGKLSMDDFKIARPDIWGYEEQITTAKDISEIVLALKKFFKFI